jgi:hypothetical protein
MLWRVNSLYSCATLCVGSTSFFNIKKYSGYKKLFDIAIKLDFIGHLETSWSDSLYSLVLKLNYMAVVSM